MRNLHDLLAAMQATKASEISVHPTPRSPVASSSDERSYTAENPGKAAIEVAAIEVNRQEKELLVKNGAKEAA
jgi:hypothetical protein